MRQVGKRWVWVGSRYSLVTSHALSTRNTLSTQPSFANLFVTYVELASLHDTSWHQLRSCSAYFCTQCHGFNWLSLSITTPGPHILRVWRANSSKTVNSGNLVESFQISNYIGHLCMLLCHEKINSIPLWRLKVTGYCSRTYTRYNFHLKQLRLDVYFFQPNIEFSSYVYEVVYCPKCYNNSVVCGALNRKQTVSQKKQNKKNKRYFPKKLHHILRNCLSALPFLLPRRLRKQNLAGQFVGFDHACMTAPLRLVIASCCASLCRASQLILHGLLL